MRRVLLVVALIALSMLACGGLTPTAATPTPSKAGPSFDAITFAMGVTEDDQPIDPTTSFPAGTTEVYAFFDYSGMQDGWEWEHKWLFEGEELDFVTDTWEGGKSGNWWVKLYGTGGAPLDPGNYRLQLYVEGELLRSGTMTIGEEAAGPSFSHVTFAEGVTDDNQPINPRTTFPTGTTEVYAFASYTGMTDGMECESVWYLDDEEIVRNPFSWEGGESGTAWVANVFQSQGLPSGTYRWELYVEGELLRTATVSIEEEAGGPSFGPITFAEGMTDDGQPINPATIFPAGTTKVQVIFDYSGMQNGMEWTSTWYRDGEKDASDTWVWDGGESGTWGVSIQNEAGVIPGEYELKLYVEGELLATGTMTMEEEAGGPSFSHVTFAKGVTDDNQPINPRTTFPAGTTEVYAFASYTGMTNGMECESVWYLDDEEIVRNPFSWDAGQSGTTTYIASIGQPGGLTAGTYLWELYVEGDLVTSGEMTVSEVTQR